MARTLIYLKENGIDSYDELAQKSSSASGDFQKKLTRIKEIETRQNEISALQKQIGTYGKTRETYRAYLKSGRSQSFYNTHAAGIILHEAAKRHFNELGMKKLPSINMLKQEYATLESEKKTLYRDYHALKEQRNNLFNAKIICDDILGIGKNETERAAGRTQKRSHAHEI